MAIASGASEQPAPAEGLIFIRTRLSEITRRGWLDARRYRQTHAFSVSSVRRIHSAAGVGGGLDVQRGCVLCVRRRTGVCGLLSQRGVLAVAREAAGFALQEHSPSAPQGGLSQQGAPLARRRPCRQAILVICPSLFLSSSRLSSLPSSPRYRSRRPLRRRYGLR